MVQVHCMLDPYYYKHTLNVCNTYWFSTETLVALMCLNVCYTYIACIFFFQNDQISHTCMHKERS